MSILTAPWFYWAVIVAVGLPVSIVVLTEIQHALNRRGSFLARPVGLLRTVIVPMARSWCCWSTPPTSRWRPPGCG